MKLPIIQEIFVHDLEKNSPLWNSLCYKPYYLCIAHLSISDQKKCLQLLEKIFKDRNHDACVPYPLYIVTPAMIHSKFFAIVNKPEDIPEYFPRSTLRVSKREQKFLSQMKILSEKVNNHNPQMRRKHLKQLFAKNKHVLDNCMKLNFYEFIMYKIEKAREEIS